MDKFKPFPYVFKYFNESRKRYWKKIFYASNVNNNNNNNKMEIQIYKMVYGGLELKGFYSGTSNILDIFKCPQCYF